VELDELFEMSKQIELTNAKIYAQFGLMLGDVDERVSHFWEEASKEEWEHYMWVNFGKELCSDHLDMSQEVEELDADRITEACAELKDYERRIDEGELDLAEAFKTAIKMETGEANVIYQTLTGYIEEAIEESGKTFLKSRLHEAEEDVDEHVQEFLDAMKRLTDDPELVQEATEMLSEQSP
jgi:DNA mismatch repair ATPase MutS